MEISCKCPVCGMNNVVTVTKRGYELWRAGCNIQDAFPNLTPDERELLQTGICTSCWDKMFPEEEEEELVGLEVFDVHDSCEPVIVRYPSIDMFVNQLIVKKEE